MRSPCLSTLLGCLCGSFSTTPSIARHTPNVTESCSDFEFCNRLPRERSFDKTIHQLLHHSTASFQNPKANFNLPSQDLVLNNLYRIFDDVFIKARHQKPVRWFLSCLPAFTDQVLRLGALPLAILNRRFRLNLKLPRNEFGGIFRTKDVGTDKRQSSATLPFTPDCDRELVRDFLLLEQVSIERIGLSLVRCDRIISG